MFELVDALFGGEQGVEVVGDALPGFGKFPLIGGIGEGGEEGFHQGLVGLVAVGLLLLQPVAEGHQFIDFGDDAVLFSEGGERNRGGDASPPNAISKSGSANVLLKAVSFRL